MMQEEPSSSKAVSVRPDEEVRLPKLVCEHPLHSGMALTVATALAFRSAECGLGMLAAAAGGAAVGFLAPVSVRCTTNRKRNEPKENNKRLNENWLK
eukprot:CAMPEP_0184485030 /NCGR_PEP_ID=MMETSP0113_2-20130426/6680_1 /TAXON_ID=91329 /ORGANISM="Norrisiella sphaerica, Strain BC52" /LENGTH=96 /DNA_ID=CAMNT_0026866287 /DNA_START=49 /DNA_END=339 /DNA_ORIENTATION=-